MDGFQHSRTALATAFYRAQHHRLDADPVLDDPYAEQLLLPEETAAFIEHATANGLALGFDGSDPQAVLGRVLREASVAASVLSRARYAEDRFATALSAGVTQYVIVGAGLDTFALRHPEWRERVRVFELDHPQSQAIKRERLRAAGLGEPHNLHFAGIDFERESLADVLRKSTFRPDEPAVFAWLGVTMYLTHPAFRRALQAMREVAGPGSELIFDFIHRDAFAESASARVKLLMARTRAVGEPMITGLEPANLATELAGSGWNLIEQLDVTAINHRYFDARSDGLRTRALVHLACAGVP